MLVGKGYKKLFKRATVIFGIIFTVVFLFSFYFSVAHAQQTSGDTFGTAQVEQGIGLASDDIRIVIARIIRVILGLLGVIALAIVAYGGFNIMTAAGNEEKVATGKKILVNGAIGLAIILSSFAITQFVLSALQRATGFGGEPGGTARPPQINIFSGSGSLGLIIKDHYPFRDAVDVRRNTKISVTFAESIQPESLINDINGNGIFGDCVTPEEEQFNWETQCDSLKTDVVKIYPSDNSDQLVSGAALAIKEQSGVFTFTFKPFEFLGNSNEEIWYTVDLTSSILKADGTTSAFASDRDGHYFWEFRVGTLLDFDPPHITATYPALGKTVARNSIIQIEFSEAMDPTVLQGFTGPDFTNVIFGNSNVSGEWRVSNGYKTLEFISSVNCGQNSCGDIMYCLPVECPSDNLSCTNSYNILTRTADLIAAGNFEAIPFTGLVDMSGNALDGNKDGLADGKPPMGNGSAIGAGEELPDNFSWSFSVKNEIDRTSPYVEKVLPGIDQENVQGEDPVQINFSMPMWIASLGQVEIQEFPANKDGIANIWFYPTSKIVEDASGISKTVLTIKHREFGPNGSALYYFTSVPSNVKSVNQNCLYPGRGPYSNIKNTSPECEYVESPNGAVLENRGCVSVDLNSATDTGCVQTANPSQITKTNVDECIDFLETISTSE